MHEQVRLWFYSLLFMSVVLDGRAPYRRVLTHGRVNDENGREMHKSWGNAIWFDDAVEELGADTMRWLYCSQTPSRDLNFGYGPGRGAARRFLTFWNSYAFFITYANLDRFRPGPDLLQAGPEPAEMTGIDLWLAARCQQLVRDCHDALDRFDLPAATIAWDSFADDLSNWYVRLSRDRFWGSDQVSDKTAAYQTLWYALVTAVRCVAPVMPLVADDIWDNLVARVDADAPVSVHLSGYPMVIETFDNPDLLEAMEQTRTVVELGRSARQSSDIRRRQPLQRMLAVNTEQQAREQLASFADLVKQECNVKELVIVADSDEFATVEVEPVFARLGPKFREDAARIAQLLRAGSYQRGSEGYLVEGFEIDDDDVRVAVRAKPGFAVSSGHGWVVALDASLTPQLALEGRARDLVRRIQQMRKDHDLEVTARIEVVVPSEAADVVASFRSWIQEQTLAVSVQEGQALTIKVTETSAS